MLRPPPISTLFPYTTLFRSNETPITYQNINSDIIEKKSIGQEPSFLSAETPSVTNYSDAGSMRSEEHTSELQSRENLVCRLLLEKKKNKEKQKRQYFELIHT